MSQASLSVRDRKRLFDFSFQRISAGSIGSGKPIKLLAYINNISDSSTPEWDERLDIGRADAKILYRSFSRTISLSFSVAVESESLPTFNMTENMLDFELSNRSANRSRIGVEGSRILTDPAVRMQDAFIKGGIQTPRGFEQATRDTPMNLDDRSRVSNLATRAANITYNQTPSGLDISYVVKQLNELSKLALPVYNGPYVGSYVMFTIGKLYTSEMGYIKNLTFEWDNSSIVWDEEYELPMITSVSMEIGYIGKIKPQVASNFFG
ncbi:hypothetical protein EBU91_01275 [bacterium]|nr:hypothetical protein [bacterium]